MNYLELPSELIYQLKDLISSQAIKDEKIIYIINQAIKLSFEQKSQRFSTEQIDYLHFCAKEEKNMEIKKILLELTKQIYFNIFSYIQFIKNNKLNNFELLEELLNIKIPNICPKHEDILFTWEKSLNQFSDFFNNYFVKAFNKYEQNYNEIHVYTFFKIIYNFVQQAIKKIEFFEKEYLSDISKIDTVEKFNEIEDISIQIDAYTKYLLDLEWIYLFAISVKREYFESHYNYVQFKLKYKYDVKNIEERIYFFKKNINCFYKSKLLLKIVNMLGSKNNIFRNMKIHQPKALYLVDNILEEDIREMFIKLNQAFWQFLNTTLNRTLLLLIFFDYIIKESE